MMGRGAILGACLALPLVCQASAAGATQPEGGRYVYVPAGATVVVLPSANTVAMPDRLVALPSAFSMARIFAEQDSLIRRAMADMDAMMAMPFPDPQQMIRSVMNGMPQAAPGSGVIMTSASSGNGNCSQTITYEPSANGAQPQVKVTRSGNACDALGMSGPVGVTQTLPNAQPNGPVRVMPRREKLWTISNPPHPVATATTPRT